MRKRAPKFLKWKKLWSFFFFPPPPPPQQISVRDAADLTTCQNPAPEVFQEWSQVLISCTRSSSNVFSVFDATKLDCKRKIKT